MAVLDNHLCPPTWEACSVSSNRTVQYSYLLRQKREFQQFIEKVDNLVPSQSRRSSCCVIDKKVHSSKDGKSIDIYIFDRGEYRRALFLKILVLKKHVLKKCDNLLIFLSSKKNAVSKLKNACMYIKCEDGDIWKIFYDVFEFLLKKSSINIIGTHFYVSLTCNCMILNELKFLHSLSKGAKVRRDENFDLKDALSKKSIKLGKKRKGVQLEKQIYIPAELKHAISDESKHKILKVSRIFSQKMLCEYRKEFKWAVFKKFGNNCTANCIEILEAQGMFDRSELIQIPIENIHSGKSQNPDSSQINQNDVLNNSSKNHFTRCNISKECLSLEPSDEILHSTNVIDCSDKNVQSQSKLKPLSDLCNIKRIEKLIPSVCCDEIEITHSAGFKSTNSLECFGDTKKERSYLNNVIKNEENMSDFLKNTFIQTEDKVQNTYQTGFHKASTSSCNMEVTQPMGFLMASGSDCNRLDRQPKHFLSASENECNRMDAPPIGFQTAAGKSLNVSKKALRVAQKLFEEVCSQEIVIDESEGDSLFPDISKGKKREFKDREDIDSDFNSSLTDKFFEEITFDEKKIESIPVQLSSVKSNITAKTSQLGKMRKSLGGRRSLKPYGVKAQS